MSKAKKSDEKRWVETWQKAGEPLVEIKRRELQAPDYYTKNLPLLHQMLNYAYENSTVRLTSGLVEQQRIFMQAHENVRHQ